MKTFAHFRADIQESFLTKDECRRAYYEGILDGTIGRCPGCGSPNLTEIETPDSRRCVDCGTISDRWRIREDEGGVPANNMGSGNIAGRDIPLFTKPEIVGPKPADPQVFRDKIFRRQKPKPLD